MKQFRNAAQNIFYLADPIDQSLMYDKLPVGNYIIAVDQFQQLFLQAIPSFTMPPKVYGDLSLGNYILDTFLSRPSGTGVLMTGEKGSGKSLLAKSVCQKAAEKGIPTILVNWAICGDNFNTFIQNINQPAVVLFDEFEKTYDREAQETLLTLLDGMFPSKKLFLFTANDKSLIDKNMLNRPGRIYYLFEFAGLDIGVVEEFCQDNLVNKEYIPRIIAAAKMFRETFTIDMLKALIEEMNRYNQPPDVCLSRLNIQPEFGRIKKSYNVAFNPSEALRKKFPKLGVVPKDYYYGNVAQIESSARLGSDLRNCSYWEFNFINNPEYNELLVYYSLDKRDVGKDDNALDAKKVVLTTKSYDKVDCVGDDLGTITFSALSSEEREKWYEGI